MKEFTKRAPKGFHVEKKVLIPTGPYVKRGDGSIAEPPHRLIESPPDWPLKTPRVKNAMKRLADEAWLAKHSQRVKDKILDIVNEYEFQVEEYGPELEQWNKEQLAIKAWLKETRGLHHHDTTTP